AAFCIDVGSTQPYGLVTTTDRGVFHPFFDHAVELVDLGKYHDTCPSVLGPARRGVVVHQGDVVATSGGGHPFWVHAKIILEYPDHGSCPFGTKIPVVKDDPVASVG